jgi:peptide deformylase
MAIREIITLPHLVLRRKARKVNNFGAELQKLIDDMVDTMRVAPGVGLAAPQVNASQRVIVVEYSEEEDEEIPPDPKLYIIVNPEIIRPSEETVIGIEGCLSVPGLAGDVERHQSVTVRGNNRRGQKVKIKADGWLARIFQHEIDHLNGVVFPDRAEKVWLITESDEEELGEPNL